MIPIHVLVCDDDPYIHEDADNQLKVFGRDKVKLISAHNVEEAKAAISNECFDIAFVDLMLHGPKAAAEGKTVLTLLREQAPGCVRVLMTAYGDQNVSDVFTALAEPTRKRTELINKSDSVEYFYDYVRLRFKNRLAQTWQLGDYHGLLEGLIEKSERVPGLRDPLPAVDAELQRVLFGIFNKPASLPLLDDARVKVRIESLPPGQSESVVAQAKLIYGEDENKNEVSGLNCFLKVGPREKIAQEIKRYVGLVQMGVPSAFRVELISNSSFDALAGICYSFVGAGAKGTIRSFDSLISAKDFGTARDVVRDLFKPEEKRWDAIVGPPVRMTKYFDDLHNVNFETNIAKLVKFVNDELEGPIDAKSGTYSPSKSVKANLPQKSDLGLGFWKVGHPTCLVHGDMHGGNLLIGSDGGISLIDYATVGIGPRFIDAAALAGSIRLQHDYPKLPLTDLFMDLLRAERALLKPQNASADAAYGVDTWFGMARLIDELAVQNFMGSANDEQGLRMELAVSEWAYALSIFGLNRWTHPQRVHLAAWCCALTSKWRT